MIKQMDRPGCDDSQLLQAVAHGPDHRQVVMIRKTPVVKGVSAGGVPDDQINVTSQVPMRSFSPIFSGCLLQSSSGICRSA